MKTFVHHNAYQLNNFADSIQQYNKATHTFYNKEDKASTCSRFIANFYSKGYNKDLSLLYKEQGFDTK